MNIHQSVINELKRAEEDQWLIRMNKGDIVHIHGIPVELTADTVFRTHPGNKELILRPGPVANPMDYTPTH